MGISRRPYPEQDSGDGNVFSEKDTEKDTEREPAAKSSAARVRRLVRLLPKQRIDAKPAAAGVDDDPGAEHLAEPGERLDNDDLIYLEALRIRGLVSQSDYHRRRAEIRRTAGP